MKMDLDHALEIADESLAGGYNSMHDQALHFLAAEVRRRASPASVPEGQALWDSVYKTLRGYRMTMMVDSDGDGYPLTDAMSPEHGTVKSGIDECTYLADAIYNDLLAAAPTPPVEDLKEAERFRDGWTHSCNALCMEIELWIDRCPHCGRPAPKAPAMQEDKP